MKSILSSSLIILSPYIKSLFDKPVRLTHSKGITALNYIGVYGKTANPDEY
ncbi:MAG: hypothetical protein FWG70_10970 [Oscillospiraceae bacterium]|nr:hypothetical protein [Oscillospiraceae bacterium]